MKTKTTIDSAVELAEKQIMDVCARRPCLARCLERLSAARGGGVCLSRPAPSRRGLFSRLWRALHGVRVVALALLLPLLARSEVVCIWQNGGWTCSGDGDYIHVGAGESWYQEAVTNLVGVCTNCSAIAPADLAALGNRIKALATDVEGTASMVNSYSANIKGYIQGLVDDVDACIVVDPAPVACSNFYYSSTAQAAAVRSVLPAPTTQGSRNYIARAGNAVKAYADATRPSLENAIEECDTLEMAVTQTTAEQAEALRGVGDQILAGAQPCIDANDWNGPTNATDSSTGKWCTEEQGDEIIDTLHDMRDYLEKCKVQLGAISNYCAHIREITYHGTFSSYTHIPVGSELGGTWQEVYFERAPTAAWGYEPTNTLQRIELILYGMAGLSTNEFEEAQEDVEYMDHSVESVTNSLATFADLSTNDLHTTGETINSLGESLRDFLNSLTPTTRTYTGGEMLSEDYAFDLGEDQYTVPGFYLPEREGSAATTFFACCRAAASCVYVIVSFFALFRYYAFFSKYAIMFTRWATDLMTALFSS